MAPGQEGSNESMHLTMRQQDHLGPLLALEEQDHLDSLLTLEEQAYQSGLKDGRAEGMVGGKIEGRAFGLKTGFEKFVESGRLAGRATVWANRQSGTRRQTAPTDADNSCSLPALPADSTRLKQRIESVYSLVEPDTLSTENTDDAVADFDDRLKRALAKAKVVERMVGRGTGAEGVRGRGEGDQAMTRGGLDLGSQDGLHRG